MPDPTLNAAIAEAYASAPSDIVILHTLELRHPEFKDDEGQSIAVRLVRDHQDLSAKLEDTAPLNPDEYVTFIAMGFDLELPPVDTSPVPEITVTIDNVSRELIKHLDAAYTLSLHDALPISEERRVGKECKHTSELQSQIGRASCRERV